MPISTGRAAIRGVTGVRYCAKARSSLGRARWAVVSIVFTGMSPTTSSGRNAVTPCSKRDRRHIGGPGQADAAPEGRGRGGNERGVGCVWPGPPKIPADALSVPPMFHEAGLGGVAGRHLLGGGVSAVGDGHSEDGVGGRHRDIGPAVRLCCHRARYFALVVRTHTGFELTAG